MECKNCSHPLESTSKYCNNCGARVIPYRITAKILRKEFFNNVLGLDNIYFKTLKIFFKHPETVVKSYIEGTRKKFIPPLTFLVISVGLITFMLNTFSGQYMAMSSSMVNASSYEGFFNSMERLNKNKSESYFTSEEYKMKSKKYVEDQMKFMKTYNEWLLKYFNIFMLVMLSFYSYLAMLTYGKTRFNYGEHLVINSYINGFTMITGILFFGLSFLVGPKLYMLSTLFVGFYYMLTYKRLYELSWKKSFLKLLKFLLIGTAGIIIFGIPGLVPIC